MCMQRCWKPLIFRNRRIQWNFRHTDGKKQTSDSICHCWMGNIRLEIPSIWPTGRTEYLQQAHWKAFAKYIGDNFQDYLDNIDFADGKSLVHWKDGHTSYKKWTESEANNAQLDHLEFCIFPQFKACNMLVNPTKSLLLVKRKKTLGHVISWAGMLKSPEIISKFKSILREAVTKPEQLVHNLVCLRYISHYLPDCHIDQIHFGQVARMEDIHRRSSWANFA